jgi:hypothetical protein
VNGLWGPAKLRAFTTNTGGGGPPDPGDAALAPGFDPAGRDLHERHRGRGK